jgi:hypothetical protein
MLSRDGTSAICPRVPDGAARWLGEAGYLHHLTNTPAVPEYYKDYAEPEPTIDAAAIASQCSAALTGENLHTTAVNLGVTQGALLAMDMGWHEQYKAHTFPMCNANGDAIGIRLRDPVTGRKWAIRGSRSGLFLAAQAYTIGGQLVVCEGPTDTAAALSLKLMAVGRPFCRGGTEYILSLVRQLHCAVVIVADIDGPGVDGAYSLADALFGAAVGIKVIRPRAKDMREWVRGGCSREMFDAVVDNCPLWQRRVAA